MLINLRTSEANKTIVQELTRRLQLGSENYVSRIAFAYSLTKAGRLNIEKDLKDSKGKEYKDDILFGKYRQYYISLVCQQYSLHKSDPNIGKYIKMHIDHGLELMNNLFVKNANYSGLDFLTEHIEKGIDVLEETTVSLDHVENKYQSIAKGYYSKPIRVQVGRDLETDEPIFFNLNDTSIHNNAHVAVAGNSGTGKTYFANSFLKQVVASSNGGVNFIYLDFKGLKKEDEEALRPFFEETKAIYIDAPYQPFPLNPLSFIDNVNEKNKIMGINKFVDIINNYAAIGKNKEQLLKEATRNAFDKTKNGLYPSLKNVFDEWTALEGDKPSTARGTIQSIRWC